MSGGPLKGGLVNYYLTRVDFPQRPEQAAYTAECEDIIESLQLNPDEANIFKEIWRGANARLDNGKQGHTPLYGAQKINHYANRILKRVSRQQDKEHSPKEKIDDLLKQQRTSTSIGALVNPLRL